MQTASRIERLKMKKITKIFIKKGSRGREYERQLHTASMENPDEITREEIETLPECVCGHLLEKLSSQRLCAICQIGCCEFCSSKCRCQRQVCSKCVISTHEGGYCPDCYRAFTQHYTLQNLITFEKINFDRKLTLLRFKLQALQNTRSNKFPVVEKVNQLRIAKIMREIEQLENRYKGLTE